MQNPTLSFKISL